MPVIVKIIKQELRERVFTWISLVFFLMLLFQGIWYTKGTFDYYVNEGVLMNAPSIFYRNFASMGMLMVIIIAIATGGVLYKDIQHKAAQWVYTWPVSDKHFFVGRYLAAFLYLLIISTGFFVGMLLTPYAGIGEAHRFGPMPIGQMLHGMLIFTIPNLLLYTSLVFFALVYTKRMAVGYLAVFLMVVFFLIVQTSYDSGNTTSFHLLGDPNGYLPAGYCAEMMTTPEKNNAYFELTGYLLHNRLLWLGVAVVLFLLAYRKFSFKYFITAGASSGKKLVDDYEQDKQEVGATIAVNRSFRVRDFLNKLFSLSRLEFMNVVRPVAFKIILVIMLVMVVLQNITWNASYYIGPEVPLTSNMTYFRLQWGAFIMMLLMIWSGELFFKDKTVKIWQITDALPVPVWVSQLSKYFASLGLAFLLCLAFIGIGILCQVIMGGGAYIDLGRYAEDLLGFRWGFLNFLLYISLVFFVAGITGNRLYTHILCVAFFIFTIISFDLGLLEDNRAGYGLVPGVDDFSDMSGYGIYQTAANWYFLMWLALAVVFVLGGILFWNRGAGQPWYQKILWRGKQLNLVGKLAMVFSLVAFFALQAFVSRQVYDKENFVSEAVQEARDARYEQKYKYLEAQSHPKYAHVDLVFDYFPAARKAVYKAEVALLATSPADSLYLNLEDFVQIKKLSVAGKELLPVLTDDELNMVVYLLPKEVQQDSLLYLTMEAEKSYTGFSQSDPQEDLMQNGSFADINEFLPYIGYQADRELTENRVRMENGLDRLTARMASVNDQRALTNDVHAVDAVWTTGTITLSTDARQTALAPGKLVNSHQADGRRFFTYKIEIPAPFNWCLASAVYNHQTKGTAGNVAYQILHHPGHAFNKPLYQDALEKGVPFIEHYLATYPYAEVRLVEVNRFADARLAFPNTIAIAEKEGWVADTAGKKEKGYLYLTIGAGLARHWVYQNIKLADVQGATMLKTALPEAFGLLFVRETLGDEAVSMLIESKMDKYAKERNNEPNTEPPLLYADDIEYLEINKGAVYLYRLMLDMQPETFAQYLQKWVDTNRGSYTTFKGLFDYMKPNISPGTVADFETVN